RRQGAFLNHRFWCSRWSRRSRCCVGRWVRRSLCDRLETPPDGTAIGELPPRAQVVVVGGGVVGCSVAYHLTKLGVTDVLLLEQGRLSGGATCDGVGLVGPLRATEAGTRLVQYSAEL